MEELPNNKRTYSLYELNCIIKTAVDLTFPDAFWVTAEIADSRCNQKGHCYLELVEKEEDRMIAQIKATIWAYEYKKLSHKFEKTTNESLRPGMKVLLFAAVTFHEVYGLSLTIRDIDPAYTLGEMALKKKEVIERLKKEGIIDMNKRLPIPLVPQRVAVITSPTAAGYGDFFNQLDNNPYGYKFIHILFPALMQGYEAEGSIIASLDAIKKKMRLFDVVVIIRGGGSVIDLNCFDSYLLASQVAGFPLPVITGIGHERDETVVDIVANTKMKTPTAVAEFLVSRVGSFEEHVIGLKDKVIETAGEFLKDERYTLNAVAHGLAFTPLRVASHYLNKISLLHSSVKNHARQLIRKEDHRFDIMEQAARHLDPVHVLRRGYSITRHKGKAVRDAAALKKWAMIETLLHKGSVTSIVQEKKEVKERVQEQTDDLLPGFDRT
jgi:exodeoxyribonuclease VII large subunit